MNGLQIEYAGQLTVVKLDVGEPGNAQIQSEFGMRGHPTLLLLDEKGGIHQRYVGIPETTQLRAVIEQLKHQPPDT